MGAPAPARGDVYATRNPDGSVSFTDVPTVPGYEVVIRETPPVLPWRDVARRESERHGLDPNLVRAVIFVESGEDPHAVSPKGARGLMQLMPGTARELGVDDPLRPRDNVRGGVAYLAWLVERFDGRLDLALAAYNAGPAAVERHRGVPPYPETRAFVERVLALYGRLKAANGG
ncbi:MAG: lytic transglycosylase domain-containing protein [Deferrisomatales bacterium]